MNAQRGAQRHVTTTTTDRSLWSFIEHRGASEAVRRGGPTVADYSGTGASSEVSHASLLATARQAHCNSSTYTMVSTL